MHVRLARALVIFGMLRFCMFSLAEPCLSSGCLDFACKAWQSLGYLQDGWTLQYSSSRCVDFACTSWQRLGYRQDAWILHNQLGRALGSLTGCLHFCNNYLHDAWILQVQLGRALDFFRMLGFCMFSLAELWGFSGYLDFACSAWQSLGVLQDAWILHVQPGTALVTFRMLGVSCKAWQSLGYLQDAEIFHVQLGRALS